MAVLTLNGTNLNDGVTYWIDAEQGCDLGSPTPEYDVYTSYSGGIRLTPVRYGLVTVTIPLYVRGTSFANLRSALNALTALVAACTYASPGTLVYADDASTPSVTYSIVDSPRPIYELDQRTWFGLVVPTTLDLRRLP